MPPTRYSKDDNVDLYVLGETEKNTMIREINAETKNHERQKRAILSAVCSYNSYIRGTFTNT
jgi:hypothetical protein